MYKLSQYNYCKPIESGGIVVYNTFSGSLIRMNVEEYESLMNRKAYDASRDDVNMWVKLGLIVEEGFDERQMVNYCRCKDTFSKQHATYRILTTTTCNARCFYCYEKDFEWKMMSEECAKSVSQFIVKRSVNKDSVMINWFGGEPLMNPNIITLITNMVAEGLHEHKIELFSTLITNASLFTDELISIAKESWRLKNIQITLDGMATTHEKRKNYINHPNAFAKTFEIIDKLLNNELPITIRLNYDKKNFEEIRELIYYIKERVGITPYLKCYAYPLFNNSKKTNDDFIQENDVEFYEFYINTALRECGFSGNTPKRRKNSCFATDPNSFVIDTAGDLYKCAMDMKDSSRSVGNILDEISLSKTLVSWCDPVLPNKCMDCIFLPLCQGGCRASLISEVSNNYCQIKKATVDFAMQNSLSSERGINI